MERRGFGAARVVRAGRRALRRGLLRAGHSVRRSQWANRCAEPMSSAAAAAAAAGDKTNNNANAPIVAVGGEWMARWWCLMCHKNKYGQSPLTSANFMKFVEIFKANIVFIVESRSFVDI